MRELTLPIAGEAGKLPIQVQQKVSEGRSGASYSAEASEHWPLGHARAAEVEDGVPERPAASTHSVGCQADGTY